MHAAAVVLAYKGYKAVKRAREAKKQAAEGETDPAASPKPSNAVERVTGRIVRAATLLIDSDVVDELPADYALARAIMAPSPSK